MAASRFPEFIFRVILKEITKNIQIFIDFGSLENMKDEIWSFYAKLSSPTSL